MANLQDVVIIGNKNKSHITKQYGDFKYNTQKHRWYNSKLGGYLPLGNSITAANGKVYQFNSDCSVTDKTNLLSKSEQKYKDLYHKAPTVQTRKNLKKSEEGLKYLESIPKPKTNWFLQAKDNTTKANRNPQKKVIADPDKLITTGLESMLGAPLTIINIGMKKLQGKPITEDDIVKGWTPLSAINDSKEIHNFKSAGKFIVKEANKMLNTAVSGTLPLGVTTLPSAAKTLTKESIKNNAVRLVSDMANYTAVNKVLDSLGIQNKDIRNLASIGIGGFTSDMLLNQLTKRTSLTPRGTYLPLSDARARAEQYVNQAKQVATSPKTKAQKAIETSVPVVSTKKNGLIYTHTGTQKNTKIKDDISLDKYFNILENRSNKLAKTVKQAAEDTARQKSAQRIVNHSNLVKNGLTLTNYIFSNGLLQVPKIVYGTVPVLWENYNNIQDPIGIVPVVTGRSAQINLGNTIYARSGGKRGLNNVKNYLIEESGKDISNSPSGKTGKYMKANNWKDKIRALIGTITLNPGNNYTQEYIVPNISSKNVKYNGNLSTAIAGRMFSQGADASIDGGVRGLNYGKSLETRFLTKGQTRKNSGEYLDTRKELGAPITTYFQRGIDFTQFKTPDGKPIIINGQINPNIPRTSSIANVPIGQIPYTQTINRKTIPTYATMYLDQAGHQVLKAVDKNGLPVEIGIDYAGPGSGLQVDGNFGIGNALKTSLNKAFGDLLWKPALQTEVVTVSRPQELTKNGVLSNRSKHLLPYFNLKY